MSKNSLEKFCNKLFLNLTDKFWFYIPENSVIYECVELTNAQELRSFLEKVIIMDWRKGPLMFDEDNHKYDEIGKSSLLSKNVLKLIGKKGKLEASSFEYIFSKYYNQVRAMSLISFWLNDDLRLEQVENRGVNADKIFQLQGQIFEKHFEELEKVFCSDRASMSEGNNSDKLELQLPILIDQLEKIESNQIESAKIVQEIVATSELYKKQEKTTVKRANKILITEQEAEQLLLATVFGIKLQG